MYYYFYKVAALLYFRQWYKQFVTINKLPIFQCQCSVTVTSYCYFKYNEIDTNFYKK
jgi:hypothetical protein